MQMVFDFSAKIFFSYNDEKSHVKLSEKLTSTLGGLMTFPLNFPGTAYHKSLKVIKIMRKYSSLKEYVFEM